MNGSFASLTRDEQPVLAHPQNWLGIGCIGALEFIYTQTNELALQGGRCSFSSSANLAISSQLFLGF